MKANELRINNLYRSAKFGTPVRCELSDLYELCIMSDGAYSDPPIDQMFLSIPLTEEWLLKLGFIYEQGDNKYHFRANEYFYLDMEFSLWFEGSYTCVDVQYVHQLQNLYFALTGEELILKS